MVKFKFFLDKQIPMIAPHEEIIEFDDDVTNGEVEEAFNDWVFEKLDSAFYRID